MNRILLLSVLAMASSTALAGPPPPISEAIPIGNDLAMLGVSLVLAGIAARIISRRTSK